MSLLYETTIIYNYEYDYKINGINRPKPFLIMFMKLQMIGDYYNFYLKRYDYYYYYYYRDI